MQLTKKQPKIHTVVLTNNKITHKGTISIADALNQDSKLRELYLNLNSIELEGCNAITEALKSNQSLKYINLAGCAIVTDDHNLLTIDQMLQQNQVLEIIDLSNNYLDDKAGQAILNGLKDNFQISHIDVRLSGIGVDIETEMQQLISRNSKMEHKRLMKGRFRFKSDQEVAQVIDKLNMKKWQKIAGSYKVKSVIALKTPKCSITDATADFKSLIAGSYKVKSVVALTPKSLRAGAPGANNDYRLRIKAAQFSEASSQENTDR